MPSTTRVPFIATRPAAWGLLVVGVVLSWQLVMAPEIGVPLTALALLAALAVVLVLATTELERDVVHMGVIGALLGALGEAWLLGQLWWHGALFGMLVGGLIGDEIQLSRKWLKLTRQAKSEQRWWQRLPLESRWLPRTVWVAFATALIALLTMPFWLPHEAGSRLAHDFFSVFRERRIASSFWSNLSHVWFAIVPLSMAVALSRFVSRVPNQALLVDGLLRRIAVLQSAALLMMAANALLTWTLMSPEPRASFSIHYGFHLEEYVDTLRLALVPCMLLMLSQIFLGKRLFLYWQRSGWIVAVGGLGMLTVMALGFLIVYTLERVV